MKIKYLSILALSMLLSISCSSKEGENNEENNVQNTEHSIENSDDFTKKIIVVRDNFKTKIQ